HGDHRGIPRNSAGDLGDQLCRRKSIAQLYACQRLADALELLHAAPRRHDQRLQTRAALAHDDFLPGRQPSAIVMLPTFHADAIGGIASIAYKPHLLSQLINRVRQRYGSRHRQLGTVRLSLAMVAGFVEIEQHRRPGEGRWLVDLAMEHAGARGCPPVNAIERIARFVWADAGDPRWVLKEPVNHPHIADGPARSQIVALQRDNLWINQKIMRLGIDAVAAMKPKEIAAFHQQRADLVVAAHVAANVVAGGHLLAGRQHADLQALALDAQARRLLIESLLRKEIFEQYPGHRP